MRHLFQNKRDEDIIGVVFLGDGISRRQRLPGLRPERLGPLMCREHGGFRRLRVCAVPRRQPVVDLRPLLVVGGVESGFDRAQSGARVTRGVGHPGRAIEEDRRGLKLVENEDQRAEQQDEELHRDLQDRIEHEAETALPERGAGQVPLHLRLVGAEVGEGQEQAAEHPRPHGVAFVEIDGEIHRLQLVEASGDREGVGQAQAAWEFRQQHGKCRSHAGENYGHLPFLRDADRFVATDRRIDDHEQSREHDRRVKPPAEHGREDDRRGVDREAGGESALQQEQARAEQARLGIETVPEVFVGRINV